MQYTISKENLNQRTTYGIDFEVTKFTGSEILNIFGLLMASDTARALECETNGMVITDVRTKLGIRISNRKSLSIYYHANNKTIGASFIDYDNKTNNTVNIYKRISSKSHSKMNFIILEFIDKGIFPV